MARRQVSPFPELALPAGNLGPRSTTRRLATIREAVALAPGTQIEPHYYRWIQVGQYEVGFRKPGKEAALVGPRYNEHDMLPTIRHQGAVIEYTPGFTTIYRELELLARKASNTLALDLLACLLYRAAFMLDHEPIDAASWRYAPPVTVVEAIESWVPEMAGFPPAVFLHLVDAIALNEDVKYLGRALANGKTEEQFLASGAGRPNNLSTCTHIAAVLLQKASLVDLLGAFARQPSGVAPLGQAEARRMFPLLQGQAGLGLA
jgi:hypothetical protein